VLSKLSLVCCSLPRTQTFLAGRKKRNNNNSALFLGLSRVPLHERLLHQLSDHFRSLAVSQS